MAKQANKPFLVALTLVLLVVIGGGLYGYRYIKSHRHESPEKLLALGDALMADKRPDEAAGKFGMAAAFSPNNPLPVTRLGDALYELGKSEPEFLPKAMAQWNAALQMNPDFKPALKSKLNAYIDDMEAYQRPANFVLVRDTAARLSKLDPSDTRAVSYQYIATLSAWMNNQQTDPAEVTRAMEGLAQLSKADPTDATMPYQIARGLIQMGQEETRTANPTAAAGHYDQAAKVMDDAVAKQPGNVGMLLRAGQIYAILDIIIPKSVSKGTHDQQAAVYLDRARSLVRKEDKNFQEVQTVYASRKLQKGDRAEAEKVYRDLLALKPNDVPVRLVLSEILQANKPTRIEAADLLERTVADGEKPNAPRTAIARALQFRAILRLASVHMDLLEDQPNPADYKALLKKVEADVAKAVSKMPENPELLKVQGRLYLIKGDVIAAVQTLKRAVAMLDQVTAQRDYELLYTLARAHLAAQNNDDAKLLLRQIVQVFPTYTPARSLLVDILLNSNEVTEAANNIDELEKQMPDSPMVARFRLMTLDSKTDKAEIERLFSKLPQENRGQVLEKARIAIMVDRVDDAITLLSAALTASPNDVRVADRLARLYLFKGDRAAATKILDSALAIAPKDPQLLILRKRVDNATPGDLFDLVSALIQETPDPLSRALQMADLERLRGNAAKMYQQLIAAEKIAPNDSRVQEQLFTYYLATKQYDVAAKYIDPLTKANYGGSYGLIYRWKLAVAKGDYPTAIAVGREFTLKMGEFPTSWITLGQALKLSGQYEEALRCFTTAREHQGANRDAIRGSIDCLYALGRAPEAKAIITSARRFFPTDISMIEMELEYELKYGDPKNAMGPILKALEKEPNQVVHYLNAATMYYRMSTQPGTPAEQTAYLSKGIEVLKTATKNFPDEMQPYINLAELQALAKDRPAAEVTLKQMGDQQKLKTRAEPKLILSEFYLRGDQLDLAEKALRDAVDVAPQSTEIRRKLAVFLSQNGRVDDALKVLDAAPDKLSLEPLLLTARLEILAAAQRWADTESAAVTALATKPNEPTWLAILANAQYNMGKFDESIATCEKVLALDAKSNRAMITRAMAKLNKPGSDLGEAVHALEAYRDLNPTDANVRRLLADAYMRLHRPDDATRELEIALHDNPGDRQVRVALLNAYRTSLPPRWTEGDQVVKDAQAIDSLGKDPEWLAFEADWLVKRNQPTVAVEKIRRAMTLAPKDMTYVQSFLSVLLSTKNYATLLRETDPMVARDGAQWWIFQARGMAREKMGDKAAAQADFRQAIMVALAQRDVVAVETLIDAGTKQLGADKMLEMLTPHVNEDVRYLLQIASLYLQKHDEANCLKLVETAMDKVDAATPSNQSRILSFAGAVYSAVTPQQTAKAMEVYQRLVKLQPDNPEALNQLAWLLANDMKPNQPDKALEYSSRAYGILLRTNRFSPTVFDTHGWVLVLSGKNEQGAEILRKVVEQGPSIEARYHLGEAYLRLGKTDEAVTQFTSAKELMDASIRGHAPVDTALKGAIEESLQKANSPKP